MYTRHDRKLTVKTIAALLSLLLAVGAFAILSAPGRMLTASAEDTMPDSIFWGASDTGLATKASVDGDESDVFLTAHNGQPVFASCDEPQVPDYLERMWVFYEMPWETPMKYVIVPAYDESLALTYTPDGSSVLSLTPFDEEHLDDSQIWALDYPEESDYDYFTLNPSGVDSYLGYDPSTGYYLAPLDGPSGEQYFVWKDYDDGVNDVVARNITVTPGTSTTPTVITWDNDPDFDGRTHYKVDIVKKNESDPTLNETVYTEKTTPNRREIRAMLPAGDYYAKVITQHGVTELLDWGTYMPSDDFTVTEGAGTVPEAPVLTVATGADGFITQFSWTAPAGADSYELFVDYYDEYGVYYQTFTAEDREGTEYSREFNAGSYSARVRAFNEGKTAFADSAPVNFSIEAPDDPGEESGYPDEFYGMICSRKFNSNHSSTGDTVDSTSAAGNTVLVPADLEDSDKIWYFEKQSDDTYIIYSGTSGNVLTVKDGSSEPNAEVVTAPLTGADSQRWTLTDNHNNARLSAKCTDCNLETDGENVYMNTADDGETDKTEQSFFICTHVSGVLPEEPVLTVEPGDSENPTVFTWTDSGYPVTAFYEVVIDKLGLGGNTVDSFTSPVVFSENERKYEKQLDEGSYRASVKAINDRIYFAEVSSDPVPFVVEAATGAEVPELNDDGTRTYTFKCEFAGAEGTGKTPLTATFTSGNEPVIGMEIPFSGSDKGGTSSVDLKDGLNYTAVFSKPGHISQKLIVGSGTDKSPIKIELIPGDVDGDGLINAHDQGALTDIFGAKAGGSDNKYDKNGDFNDDGVINAADRAEIVRNYNSRG